MRGLSRAFFQEFQECSEKKRGGGALAIFGACIFGVNGFFSFFSTEPQSLQVSIQSLSSFLRPFLPPAASNHQATSHRPWERWAVGKKKEGGERQ